MIIDDDARLSRPSTFPTHTRVDTTRYGKWVINTKGDQKRRAEETYVDELERRGDVHEGSALE